MGAEPLCPIVLSLLASGPRRPHEVARGLAVGYGAAGATLERLRSAGLVRRRGDWVFAITRRGRSELALQRMLVGLAAGVRGAA
jgi:predicted transcriptional regulator